MKIYNAKGKAKGYSMKQWYAARVMTGKEYEVREKIKKTYKDYEVYIPRRLITEYVKGKIHQRTEKMLPGYLLIAFSSLPTAFLLQADYLKILGEVAPIEIERLKTQEIQEDGYMETGQKIIINNGPFAGVKGNILSILFEERCKGIAKCRLVFQGQELEVNMRLDYISTI